MAITEPQLLGHITPDTARSTNERVMVRATYHRRSRILRNQYVTITDALNTNLVFLGRLITGPFFPEGGADSGEIQAQIEI